MELLLGCGRTRDRRIAIEGRKDWAELVTLDSNPDHQPNIVHDLAVRPWPIAADSFDEVHAYEVLEHLGRQGDWRTFFDDFAELWRILKPDGYLAATCPSYLSMWAWGDPSHTRVLTRGSLVFLDQEEYAKQLGKTPMSDFRHYWRGDFKAVWLDENAETFAFVLQARKGLDTPCGRRYSRS